MKCTVLFVRSELVKHGLQVRTRDQNHVWQHLAFVSMRHLKKLPMLDGLRLRIIKMPLLLIGLRYWYAIRSGLSLFRNELECYRFHAVE